MEATSPQLLNSTRLIIATNRGPAEFYRGRDKKLKYRRGVGGVVTALIELGKCIPITWVALSMTDSDRLVAKETEQNGNRVQASLCDEKMQLRYVNISKTAYHKHYDEISNRVLWFLQHHLYTEESNLDTVNRIKEAWVKGYYVANQAIADAVIEEVKCEASNIIVMLHDQHLYLAPSMIRKIYPSIIIQYFIHIPWPEVHCWYLLPPKIVETIYNSLICNDIIGFQTERDAGNFLEGVRTFVDGSLVDVEAHEVQWRNHRTQVRVYPISISVVEERSELQTTTGRRFTEKFLPQLSEYTIMRVDRIDPTKNIVLGFQAYARLLEEHQDLRGKVIFWAFLVPSRQALYRYQQYKSEVLAIIKEINQRYGTHKWQPIHAYIGNDRTRALAAMQFYDVLLVNPIIDGMNLVAKEGAVVNQREGVLVLSCEAGAFLQMEMACIPITPADIIETTQALFTALMLSREERHKMATLARDVVEKFDLNFWFTQQFQDINLLLCPLPFHPGELVTPTLSLTDCAE
jgi:trehalose 6-phosphate synthase